MKKFLVSYRNLTGFTVDVSSINDNEKMTVGGTLYFRKSGTVILSEAELKLVKSKYPVVFRKFDFYKELDDRWKVKKSVKKTSVPVEESKKVSKVVKSKK